ncbi:MAG: glycosyltransferase, partial [Deltaproteobacteria bacterium]|nr:glycosyltransferase [Deltaproteobacteria bacterium]
RTLQALAGQKVGFPFEIIAVDSGSTDGTLEFAERFQVKTYRIPPTDFNFGLTRDYAFSLAEGDIIVTLSQDVIPCGDSWLDRMVAPFPADERIAAVQGKTIVPKGSDVFYWERKGQFYFTSESRNWIERYQCGLSFVNCAIRRDFWEGHRMGPTPFSEDKLFQKIIHESGMSIHEAKEALCFHGHQYTWKSLVARLKNEGVGWRQVGVRYGLGDCLTDIYRNKWMIRKSLGSWERGEIRTIQELLFPVLRPACIYYGNSRTP